MRLSRSAVLFCTITFVLLTGCQGLKYSSFQNQLANSSCQIQTQSQNNHWQPDSVPILRPEMLSERSVLMAEVLGINALINQFHRILLAQKQEPDDSNRIQLLESYLRIQHRIQIASLAVSGIASELDCEEERCDQIATYISGIESRRETRLTVSAITIGALGAIVSGVLLLNNPETISVEYIGIGVGVTEAVLGVFILKSGNEVEFHHPRNPLKAIWTGEDKDGIFPSFVWRYLNHPKISDHPEFTLRDQIVGRWISFSQFDLKSPKKQQEFEQKYFGEIGKYSSDELFYRADMHDQVESNVNLVKQDLTQLALELESLIYE